MSGNNIHQKVHLAVDQMTSAAKPDPWLAQKVRSLGIHLIIATQRPSANIVTGVLKANIPYRISFRLPSHTDSQTILDMSGAENLLGKGDMLLVTDSDTIRMQGLYIPENDLDEFVKSKL